MAESLTDQLSALGEQRQRLMHGYTLMLNHAPDLTWDKQADEQWASLSLRYVRTIASVLDGAARDDLTDERDALMERLERGWLMAPSEAISEEQIITQFATVLARYEAVCDALTGTKEVEIAMMSKLNFVRASRQLERARSARGRAA